MPFKFPVKLWSFQRLCTGRIILDRAANGTRSRSVLQGNDREEAMDSLRWANVMAARKSYEAGASRASEGPLEAFFEVAARCNLHCQMCAINYDSRYLPGSKRPPYLTPDLFQRLEPIFPSLNRAYLFGLGEPLLNKHLLDYLRTLSSAGVEAWFNTNGTLIDDDKAEALALAGASAITVSIDGVTPETYESIRVGAKFSDVLRGIRSLVRASRIYGRPSVDLSFVGMASNLHELPRLVDFAAEVGARGVHVEPLYSQIQHDLQEHYARENLGLLGSQRVDELFGEAKRRASDTGVRLASRFLLGAGSADYVERSRGFDIWWTCTEPWTSIWVTSAGEVRTCCINETSFGNLFEQPFSEIWNGRAYAEFRAQHASRRETPQGCANCIRNGRVRHSSYFAALEAVTYKPLSSPLEEAAPARPGSAELLWPADGAVVTDPLPIRGRLPNGGPPPDLVIDRRFVLPLRDAAVWNAEEFLAIIEVPFLTEGAHLLSLRARGESGDDSMRTVHFWKPAAGTQDVRATDAVALGRHDRFSPSRAAIRVDGEAWPASRWIRSRAEERGVAWLDLKLLKPGPHTVSIKPRWRAVSDYTIFKL
jgi:radical SAM protein with 4Fe4S-binding SPASM domain